MPGQIIYNINTAFHIITFSSKVVISTWVNPLKVSSEKFFINIFLNGLHTCFLSTFYMLCENHSKQPKYSFLAANDLILHAPL